MPAEFKSISASIQLESHTIHKFLENEGGKLVGAYKKIGTLFLLTSSEAPLYSKVETWYKELNEWLQSELSNFNVQKERYIENSELDEVPEVTTPDSYKFEFEITHPRLWDLINFAKKIDSSINDIENMWLAGMINDEARTNAVNRVINIPRKLTAKIDKVTAVGKDRKGGPFKASQFVSILRGGLELYIDDKAIEEENRRIKSSLDKKPSKSPKNKTSETSKEEHKTADVESPKSTDSKAA